MQLKPEILSVLNTLGAAQIEIDGLTQYFGTQLQQAQSLVDQIGQNITSLQTQQIEAQNQVVLLSTAISKFVVM